MTARIRAFRAGPLSALALVVVAALLAALGVAAQPAHASGASAIAYVVNNNINTVSAVNTATNTITATITVGNSPDQVAVNPAGTFAYVTNDGGDNTVSVISTASNTVTATIPVGNYPFGVAINPAGTFAYVVNDGNNTVSVISTASNTVTATIPVSISPLEVSVNPAGTFAYVTSNYQNDVQVISTATNTVTATIPIESYPAVGGPFGVAINPAGTLAYVTNNYYNTVSVISTATNTITATIPVGNSPQYVAVSPDGTLAYVTNQADNTVSVISTATNTVTATIPVGNDPSGVAVSPDGTLAYVTNNSDNTVSVISTATNTVTATNTNTGFNGPSGVAFVPAPAVALPAVTSVSPASGPAAGGTPVTITGTNLAGATAVTFGSGGNATGVSCTATSCTATSPAASAGTVDVTVTTAGGTSATSAADQYTYVAPPTTTSVASSASPSTFGQPVTFTATVAGGDGGGTVAFYADGSATPIAGCEALSLADPPTTQSYQAACTTSDLAAGSHVITASYSGDAGSAPSSGTLAGGQTVVQASTTTVASSANPSAANQAVTFTATVTGDGGGTVAFYADGSATPITGCAAVTLTDPGAESWDAACTTPSLAIGTHTITASYSGDGQYAASTGTLAGGQTVNPAATATTVASSANPSAAGQPVTFTATVTGDGGGTVAFYADGSATPITGCAAVALADPPSLPFQATCTTSALAAGTHTITASYSGDAQYAASTGTLAGGQTVNKVATVITSTSTLQLFAAGGTATVSATLTTTGGAPVPGKPVTITLGSGSAAQSCTAITASTGTATCTITPVAATAGPQPLTDAFAGDSSDQPSANTQQALVFAYSTGGLFAVGNGSQTGAVTFWGAQWAKDNTLSGGAAPSAFKGFENTPAQPGCGTSWTTGPGNSPSPPAGPLPAYMAVVVTSSVTSSGSTITGNTVHIVIVKTSAGYAPDPGNAGTGTVVGTYC